MANYDFRYRLQSAPEARSDGSGCVSHDIYAEYQANGGGWQDVPSRHKSVEVPASEIMMALASGDPTQAYKQALVANVNNQPVPIAGWSKTLLEALMVANDAAIAAAVAADEYITVTLGLSYPVSFNL